MPIRSLDQLQQFLADEIRWRKRELTALNLLLGKARRQHEESMLLRVAVCLLYAHWEGFVKAAATGYISYVATRGLRYRDLTPNFIALGLRGEITNAGNSNSPTLHAKLVSSLISGLSDRARLGWRDAVNTRSNLDSKVLREILCLLGLDPQGYLTNGMLLDERLLRNRNNIAHGQVSDIQPDDYALLHSRIIAMIEGIRTDIENAAAQRLFQVNPP